MYPLAKLPLREPGFVTVTVTAPALPAGVVAVIDVALTTVTFVAEALPNVTVAPDTKFVPVIVTAVPPAVVPVFGDTLVTVGVTAYVYPLARLPLITPGFVTVTVTAPAVPAGVVAVIDVALTTVTFVADALPNVTVAPVANPVPVIVTAVPPAGGPVLGETLVTVGGVTYVKPPGKVPTCPFTVTVTVTAPASPDGIVAVIVVLFTTVTLVAARRVSKIPTVAPAAKFVPVIVTTVPPAVDPVLGFTAVTVGAAAYVYPLARAPLCPLLFVTVTVTVPALPAGVVAVIVVLLVTTTFVAAALPNVTVAPDAKFVPVIVTAVPPARAPPFGDMLVTVGGATYMNALVRLPLWDPTVTATVTVPALPAGEVAVIVVLFTTTTLVAATPPNVTVAPEAKFVPVMVTAVPPAVGPLFGDTFVTVGAGTATTANVAICMTHGPDPVNVAVAVLLPAAVTILSSARSPSGVVIIRDVKPLPADAFPVATVFAPKMTSLALVVVAAPLLAAVLLPLAPAVTSSAVTPRYSRILTSGYAAA